MSYILSGSSANLRCDPGRPLSRVIRDEVVIIFNDRSRHHDRDIENDALRVMRESKPILSCHSECDRLEKENGIYIEYPYLEVGPKKYISSCQCPI
jgi:hypothetical protein